MALYLNLYHEIQNKKLKQQRDPLKIAIMCMIVTATGLVAYYFWRLESVNSLRDKANQVVADMKKNDPLAVEAKKQYDAYDMQIKLADAIVHKMENRFYWAPLLEQLIQIVPPEVQVTNLDGAISTDGLKKVTLAVTGLATGSEPREVAERLRTQLITKLNTKYTHATANFRSLEDSAEAVQFQGKSSPTVQFVIDITFTSSDVANEGKTDFQAPQTPVRGPKS